MHSKPTIRSYRDLVVWQRAMSLVVGVYDLTRHFPPEERFGLSAQLRRAAVSVPANIAEGHGRVHRAEYVHHVSIARGSLLEVETLLLLSLELRLGKATAAAPLLQTCNEVGRMIGACCAHCNGLQEKGSEADSCHRPLMAASPTRNSLVPNP